MESIGGSHILEHLRWVLVWVAILQEGTTVYAVQSVRHNRGKKLPCRVGNLPIAFFTKD